MCAIFLANFAIGTFERDPKNPRVRDSVHQASFVDPTIEISSNMSDPDIELEKITFKEYPRGFQRHVESAVPFSNAPTADPDLDRSENPSSPLSQPKFRTVRCLSIESARMELNASPREFVPASSPRGFSNGARAGSPVSAPYLRIYPSIPGDPFDVGELSPMQVIRKSMKDLSLSLKTTTGAFVFPVDPKSKIGRWVKEIESVITPSLIDSLLTLQLVPLVERDLGAFLTTFGRLTTEISALRTVSGSLHADIMTAFRDSEPIQLFSRVISEVLVDIANSRTISTMLLQQASSVVNTYIMLGSAVDLDMAFLSNHSDILQRMSSVPGMVSRSEVLSAVPNPRSVSPPTDIEALKGNLLILEKELSDDKISQLEGLRESDSIFEPIQFITRVITKSVSSVPRLFSEHDQIVHNFSEVESVRETFCSKYVTDILILLVNGLGDEEVASMSITRLAIDLVSLCKTSIALSYKFFLVFPRLLQSGVNTVPVYPDGDVVMAASQGQALVPSILQSLNTFTKLELMNEVFVEFVGTDAIGTDGLRREWISRALSTMSDISYGLFEYTDTSRTFIRPTILTEGLIEKFRGFGRILGLALRYGITPGVALAPSCIRILLNRMSPFSDQEEIDALLYDEDKAMLIGLNALLTMDEATLASLELRMPLGLPVDTRNVAKYVEFEKSQILMNSVRPQLQLITVGIIDTVRQIVFESLTVEELTMMIQGESEIDIDSLQKNTSWRIVNGLKDRGLRFMSFHSKRQSRLVLNTAKAASTPTVVKWLFEILKSFSQEQVHGFMSFVSGSSRPPIGGFVAPEEDSSETQREWMHVYVDESLGVDWLPKSHTCYVTLTVPQYESIDIMREKLLRAIEIAVTIELA